MVQQVQVQPLGVLVWQKSLLKIVTYGSPMQLFISDCSLAKTIDLWLQNHI
jgi:hypothetical protein